MQCSLQCPTLLWFLCVCVLCGGGSGAKTSTCIDPDRNDPDCKRVVLPFKPLSKKEKKDFDEILQDGNGATCTKDKAKAYRVKLFDKRTFKALVEVYMDTDNFGDCQMRQGDADCEDFTKRQVSPRGKMVIYSTVCEKAITVKRQVRIDCDSKKARQLCEIKVSSGCEALWWDVRNGCDKKCSCSGSGRCDAWNGTCLDGHALTTTATPTTTMTTSATTKLTTATTTITTMTTSTTAMTTTLTTATTTTPTPKTSTTTATTTPVTIEDTTESSPTVETTAPEQSGSTLQPSSGITSMSPDSSSTSVKRFSPTTGDVSTEPLPTQSPAVTADVYSSSALPSSSSFAAGPSSSRFTSPTPSPSPSHFPFSSPSPTDGVVLSTDRKTTSSITVAPDRTTRKRGKVSTATSTAQPSVSSSTIHPSTSITSTDQPKIRSTNQPVRMSTDKPFSLSTKKPIRKSTDHPTSAQMSSLAPKTDSADDGDSEDNSGIDDVVLAPDGRGEKASLGEINDGGEVKKQTTSLPLILGVAGVALLVVIVATAVGLRAAARKRGRKSEDLVGLEGGGEADQGTPDGQLEMTSPNGCARSDVTEGEEVNVYANVTAGGSTPTADPIPLPAFTQHVATLFSTGNVDREFKELPKGLQRAVTAAEEANGGETKKNRFSDILPYDDSRVLLAKETEGDSDYINASYIDGFVDSMAYIAAQGPLAETVGDFWHMVWADNCGKIVMLTNLCEGTKIKCEQYWPEVEGASKSFGRYTVTNVKVTLRAHFIQRSLRLTKAGDDVMARDVELFHFTAWPDHGVPCPVALVHFWSAVTSHPSPLSGPLLVHCSAGIGRTGTFIALDMLTHQAESTGKVSVFPTVRRLRAQRVNMVQTASQYRFLHEVVAEWLGGRNSVVSREELQHSAQWTQGQGETTQLSDTARERIRQEFQVLCGMRPQVADDQVITAKLEENMAKNRSPGILPVEQHRVSLWTQNEDDNDYINAVFLSSLCRQQGYIVTQLPVGGAEGDLWRLVLDWRVKVFVTFPDTPTGEGVTLFPTEGETIQHGAVKVETISKTASAPGVLLYSVKLTRSQGSDDADDDASDDVCSVSVYSVEPPGNQTQPLVSLVNRLMPLVTIANQPPVLLQCFDGARQSCVLGALMLAVETLEAEGSTSPFMTSRLIHTARPAAFTAIEDYESVFACLVQYVRGQGDTGHPSHDNDEDHIYNNASNNDEDHIYNNASNNDEDHIYNNDSNNACDISDDTAPIYNNA